MEYLTVAEVTERTGISAATIRAMAREGVLKAYESGGRWVIPAEAVDSLEEQMAATEAAIEEEEEQEEEQEEEDEDEDEDLDEDDSDDILENPEDDDDADEDEDDSDEDE